MTTAEDIIHVGDEIVRGREVESLKAGEDIVPTQLITEFVKLYVDENTTLPLPNALVIDISKHLSELIPEFYEYFMANPKKFLKAVEFEVGNQLGKAHTVHFKNICTKDNKANFLKVVQAFETNNLDKLIHIEGIVRSAGYNDNRVVLTTFRCRGCETDNDIAQHSFTLTRPICCSACGGHEFRIGKSERVPITIFEIEELPENDDDNNSAILVFAEDNTHRFLAKNQIKLGSRVRLTAFVSITPEWAQKKEEYMKSMQKNVLVANYVELLEEEIVNTTITKEDEAKIQAIANDPKVYETLISSIAPNLEGMSDVKEAILYAMFGGVRRIGKVNTRGLINILLVSDPSKGKTTLFEYIKKMAPKIKRISGGGTTKAGLGAGATRSEITGKFTIEAGALVMANKGLLLLDELDKMSPEDMAALHESMESCTVTKAIVGQNRSFNAETTVIAACNPEHSRFDIMVPLTKQIKLAPSLLSRFDAIFAMRDIPNEAEDLAIVTRIYQNYSQPDSINPAVPPELLRKYIIYAKRIIPSFTPDKEVQESLAKFYVGLRKTSVSQDGVATIPIATRHAESILRFAEASARIRLSSSVDKQDIERAIRIILNYLKAFGLDPVTGRIDVDRIMSDSSVSSRNVAKIILDVLSDKTPISFEGIFNRVKEKLPNVKEQDVDEAIRGLKHDIFEPRANQYQLIG